MAMSLTATVKSAFSDYFGYKAEPLLVTSPGRINLIGEHTDYNNGFVLPAAIDRTLVLAAARNSLGRARLIALDMKTRSYKVHLPERASDKHFSTFEKSPLGWPNYILGCVEQLMKSIPDRQIEGFDIVFSSDIPIGAGLSSSAALETGTLYALSELFGLNRTRLQIATMAQRAEQEFVGVQCGIMDQFANMFGREGDVIRLDCRSMEYTWHPFPSDRYRILLCDTNIRRELAASEYNRRREECEESVRRLQEFDPEIQSLRDLNPQLLEQAEVYERLGDPLFRRSRFVIEENTRVLKACEDLERGDLASFGKRMYESHQGLRDDYEVSCKELDLLAEAAAGMDGVMGARMMGGGFGGCTINVVEVAKLDEVSERLSEYYLKQTGQTPGIHVTGIGPGTSMIEPER